MPQIWPQPTGAHTASCSPPNWPPQPSNSLIGLSKRSRIWRERPGEGHPRGADGNQFGNQPGHRPPHASWPARMWPPAGTGPGALAICASDATRSCNRPQTRENGEEQTRSVTVILPAQMPLTQTFWSMGLVDLIAPLWSWLSSIRGHTQHAPVDHHRGDHLHHLAGRGPSRSKAPPNGRICSTRTNDTPEDHVREVSP
jgi:hypothetical protein